MASGQDLELRQMAEMELADLKVEREALWAEILDMVAGGEDAQRTRCMLEIRAGTGGDEAALFARDLYLMYRHYCEAKGWKVEVMDMNATELGGFKEVILGLEGEGVFRAMQYENGGHRVQRVPETEAKGRVHTSAATVAVMPEPEDLEIDLKPADYVVERLRTFQRSRRPARQQDGQRHPPYAPSLGAGGLLPGRKEPAQEPFQGPPRAQEPAVRVETRGRNEEALYRTP